MVRPDGFWKKEFFTTQDLILVMFIDGCTFFLNWVVVSMIFSFNRDVGGDDNLTKLFLVSWVLQPPTL